MKSTAAKDVDSAVRIVKVGHCPSLSGKSKLTYQIGSVGKDDIRVRVVGNTAPGTFDDSWVGLHAIEDAFEKCRKGEPITAVALDKLYRGRSMNTPFFVFAALKAEGLVKTAKDSPRGYERADSKAFVAKMQAQLKGTQDGQGSTKPKKSKAEVTAPRKAPQKSRA